MICSLFPVFSYKSLVNRLFVKHLIKPLPCANLFKVVLIQNVIGKIKDPDAGIESRLTHFALAILSMCLWQARTFDAIAQYVMCLRSFTMQSCQLIMFALVLVF